MDAISSVDEQESVHPAHLPSQLSLVLNNLQLWYILFTCCNHSWDTLTWSLLKHLSCCISIFSRGPQTSQKSRSHFQILGTIMVKQLPYWRPAHLRQWHRNLVATMTRHKKFVQHRVNVVT